MTTSSADWRASWKRVVATAAALGSLAAPVAVRALTAQAPQTGADAPAFEVASIKPNNSGDGRIMLGNQPGRFTATNVTLRLLIRNAYQLQDFQISGGPGWIAPASHSGGRWVAEASQ